MLKTLLYIFLMLTVISTNHIGQANTLSSLLVPKPAAAQANNPCADIQNGQFVCLDCSTLGYCVKDAGNWIAVEVAPCAIENNMYCNANTKSCTFQQECFIPNDGISFECQNPGKYPDPFDCRVYHICNNLNEDTRLICASGLIYSPETQNCKQGSTNSDVCRYSQFRCDRPGMMGAWPDDENIYYVCRVKYVDGKETYYPLMYRCQSGYVFDGKNCVTAATTQSTPTTMNTQTTMSDSCTENKLIPHPTNCRAYYRCEKGKLILETCPQNTYFNTSYFSCAFGNC